MQFIHVLILGPPWSGKNRLFNCISRPPIGWETIYIHDLVPICLLVFGELFLNNPLEFWVRYTRLLIDYEDFIWNNLEPNGAYLIIQIRCVLEGCFWTSPNLWEEILSEIRWSFYDLLLHYHNSFVFISISGLTLCRVI